MVVGFFKALIGIITGLSRDFKSGYASWKSNLCLSRCCLQSILSLLEKKDGQIDKFIPYLTLVKIFFKPEEFRWPWAPEPEPFPVWMPTTELEGAESILASDRWYPGCSVWYTENKIVF